MSKYHINKKGVPALCRAQKGKCPLGEHFETRELAQEQVEKENSKNNELLPGMTENNRSEEYKELRNLAEEGKFSQLSKEIDKTENITEFEGAINHIQELKGDKKAVKQKVDTLNSQLKSDEARRKEIIANGEERKQAKIAENLKIKNDEIANLEKKVEELNAATKEDEDRVRAENSRPCPKCGKGKMTMRSGPYGSFLGCSNYPNCKNVIKEFATVSDDTKEIRSLKSELAREINKIKYNEIPALVNSKRIFTDEEVKEAKEIDARKIEIKQDLDVYKSINAGRITGIEARYDKKMEEYNVRDKVKTFDRKPYLKPAIIEEHYDKLMYVQNEVNEKLKDQKGFDGIDFCDVSAGGVQIRGHHKEVNGYAYGEQITIKYDFSNYQEASDQFIDMWKAKDNPKALENYKDFLAQGERWGWD